MDLTEKDYQEIIRDYQSGTKLVAIEAKYHLHNTLIYRILRRANIALRYKPRTKTIIRDEKPILQSIRLSPELQARLECIDKKLNKQDEVLGQILNFGAAMDEDMKLDIIEAYLRAYSTDTPHVLAEKILKVIQVIIYY